MSTHRLTKSRFMDGLECTRRMWLRVHEPRAARPLTLAERHRMQAGTEFGRAATRLFPGGIRIEQATDDPDGALVETERLLQSEAPALFEAALRSGEVLIRADILERSPGPGDGWHLIEVKSQSNAGGREPARSSKLRKLLPDMALQLQVAEGAGLRIDRVSLGWVDSRYERRGNVDWPALVAIDECTSEVRDRAAGIGDEIARALAVLDAPEMPEAPYAKSKCGGCVFNPHCWGDEPADSIIHLPGVKPAQIDALRAIGVARIPDIPDDFALTPAQAAARRAFDAPDGRVTHPAALARWLEKLEYPLYYLDFESWNPCVPPFDHVRPYAQIPFQYSLHVQQEPDGETSHHAFLADAGEDPRPALVERLLPDLGERGSIVAHHARFERARISELAVFSPAHAEALRALLPRFVDTETPFKRHWVAHPALFGRSSIKVVLPVLAPGLDYGDLEIADGSTASIRFGDMQEGKVVGEEAEAVRRDLLEYCRRDTWAMVKVVESLRRMAG